MGTRTPTNVSWRKPGARTKWTCCSRVKDPVQVRDHFSFPLIFMFSSVIWRITLRELWQNGCYRVTAAECRASLSLGGLCSPDLSIYHWERKSVALWSEQCEIPSGFKQSLTPLARTHARAFLSALSLTRCNPHPLSMVFSNSEFSASEPHRPSSQISHAPSVAVENKSFWRTFNRCEELLASASNWLSSDQWKSHRALHLICTLQSLLPHFLTRAFESWRVSGAPCCFLLIGN